MDLQHAIEEIRLNAIADRSPPSFRQRVFAMSRLAETGEVEQDMAHRTARLYRSNVL